MTAAKHAAARRAARAADAERLAQLAAMVRRYRRSNDGLAVAHGFVWPEDPPLSDVTSRHREHNNAFARKVA